MVASKEKVMYSRSPSALHTLLIHCERLWHLHSPHCNLISASLVPGFRRIMLAWDESRLELPAWIGEERRGAAGCWSAVVRFSPHPSIQTSNQTSNPTMRWCLNGPTISFFFLQKSQCQQFERRHHFQTVLMRVRIFIPNIFCHVDLLYYLFWAQTLDRASGGRQWGVLTSWATVCLKRRARRNFISTTCQSMLSEGWRLHSPLRENRHRVPTLTVHCYITQAAADTCAWLITAFSDYGLMRQKLACSLKERYAVFITARWVYRQMINLSVKLQWY